MLFEEYIKIGPFGKTTTCSPHCTSLVWHHFFGVMVLREECKNIGCIGICSIYSAIDSGTELKSTAAVPPRDAHTDRCWRRSVAHRSHLRICLRLRLAKSRPYGNEGALLPPPNLRSSAKSRKSCALNADAELSTAEAWSGEDPQAFQRAPSAALGAKRCPQRLQSSVSDHSNTTWLLLVPSCSWSSSCTSAADDYTSSCRSGKEHQMHGK